jgi:hypothetical protein
MYTVGIDNVINIGFGLNAAATVYLHEYDINMRELWVSSHVEIKMSLYQAKVINKWWSLRCSWIWHTAKGFNKAVWCCVSSTQVGCPNVWSKKKKHSFPQIN